MELEGKEYVKYECYHCNKRMMHLVLGRNKLGNYERLWIECNLCKADSIIWRWKN